MIKRLIRNIRRKPKAVRDHIAFGVAGVFTAGVAFIWMYHLPFHQIDQTTEVTSITKESGFLSIFDDFKEQFAAVRSSFSSAATSSETEIPDKTPEVVREIRELPPAATTTTHFVATSTLGVRSAATSSVLAPSTTAPRVPRPVKIVTVSAASTTATTSENSQ